MSRIDFNNEVLQSNAVDRLNSSLEIINENTSMMDTIIMPEDFKDKGDFLLVKEDIISYKKMLEDVLNAINGINEELDTYLFNFETRVSSLPESSLKNKNNNIY